jgi:putative adenylate-forming enzyme
MRAWNFIKAYLSVIAAPSFKNRYELEQWQREKIKKHLSYISQNSPFYKSCGPELNQYPIINKKIMMDHFTQMNTANLTKDEALNVALQSEQSRDFSAMLNGISVGLSSGTSGSRGLFVATEDERAIWAGKILGKYLHKPIFHKQKIALFLRANNNLYSSLNSKRIKFKFFDIINPVETYINQVKEYNPSIIVGPPSVLRKVFELCGGKTGNDLVQIISGAEVLDPLDKKIMQQLTNMRIDQIYQCTEGFLAYTCRAGNLHLNEDMVYFEKEYIDQHKFVPIITDFTRKTQPIIRYRLNDVLTISRHGCSCGSPFTVLAQIEGRCDDIFIFNTPKRREIYPDFIRRAVIECSDSIEHFRVRQHPTFVELMLISKNSSDVEKVKQSLMKLFSQNEIQVEIKISSYLDVQGANKLKRVERCF